MKKNSKNIVLKAPVRVMRIKEGRNVITDEISYLDVKKILGHRNSTYQGKAVNIVKVFLEDGSTREYLEHMLIKDSMGS